MARTSIALAQTTRPQRHLVATGRGELAGPLGDGDALEADPSGDVDPIFDGGRVVGPVGLDLEPPRRGP